MRALRDSPDVSIAIARGTGSVLARLGRLKVEPASAVGDKDESKRRMILFEWVSSICYEQVSTLILA